MAQWKPKGQDDVVARMARLEKQIEELSRRPVQRDRVKANLYYANYLKSEDQWLSAGSWESIPEIDTADMYRRSSGPVHIEIPYEGRWRIRFDSAWGKQYQGTSNYTAAAFLKLNNDYPKNPPFLYNTGEQRMHSWGYAHIVAECEHVFSRGDKIYPGVYSSVTNAVVVGSTDDGTTAGWPHPTYIMAEYIGPN